MAQVAVEGAGGSMVAQAALVAVEGTTSSHATDTADTTATAGTAATVNYLTPPGHNSSAVVSKWI